MEVYVITRRGWIMNGIIFFGTNKLEEIEKFYIETVGCEVWLRQADCTVLKFGNMVFGFCQREQAETNGILCFVLPGRAEVDEYYDKLKIKADDHPQLNEKYKIYHFFASDPENRKIEFQSFEHDVEF